jgi:hypothetical protein
MGFGVFSQQRVGEKKASTKITIERDSLKSGEGV